MNNYFLANNLINRYINYWEKQFNTYESIIKNSQDWTQEFKEMLENLDKNCALETLKKTINLRIEKAAMEAFILDKMKNELPQLLLK